jgi:hypothetical protein
MAAVRNGNFSLDEVLNQDILNNNCVERPVDYLQKVMKALGSFTREKICQNVAFFVDECAEQGAIPFNIGTPSLLRGAFIIPLGYKKFRTPFDAIFGSYPMDFFIPPLGYRFYPLGYH